MSVCVAGSRIMGGSHYAGSYAEIPHERVIIKEKTPQKVQEHKGGGIVREKNGGSLLEADASDLALVGDLVVRRQL